MLQGWGLTVVPLLRPLPHASKAVFVMKTGESGVQLIRAPPTVVPRLPAVMSPALGSKFPAASKSFQPVGTVLTAAPCFGERKLLKLLRLEPMPKPARMTVVPLPVVSYAKPTRGAKVVYCVDQSPDSCLPC